MPKILKTEKSGEYTSFQIQFSNNMVLWFDTHYTEDNELTGDWNKYIFYTNSEEDMRQKAFQEDCINFENALNACEEFLSLNK